MGFNIFNYNLKRKLFSKPHRNKLLIKTIRKFTKIYTPEKWVFIIGCYNSGTTLLQKLISQHPDVSSIEEGAFLTDQLITPEELGWPRMWHKVMEDIRIDLENNNIDIEKIKKDWSIFLNKNKNVFLEKSIVNSSNMKWFQSNFNNPHFIFIVRNGYAVAEGIKRKSAFSRRSLPKKYGNKYPIDICINQWIINNQIIENDSNEINKIKRIFYEDLCKNPDKVINDLYEYIGLKQTKKEISDKKWKIQEKYSRIKNMNSKSINNLSSEEIRKINDKASNLLKFYNYKIL